MCYHYRSIRAALLLTRIYFFLIFSESPLRLDVLHDSQLFLIHSFVIAENFWLSVSADEDTIGTWNCSLNDPRSSFFISKLLELTSLTETSLRYLLNSPLCTQRNEHHHCSYHERTAPGCTRSAAWGEFSIKQRRK